MPPSTPPSSDAPSQRTAGDEGDPLAGLHRMSTTAGVASQQYVAVNTTAIIAVILGLASALSILSNLLLFVAAAGVIVSIAAWRQIRNSNGTETGTALAVLGLLLSLGIGGGVAYRDLAEQNRTAADVRQMNQIVDKLAAAVKAKQYDQAYQLFDDIFRQRVSARAFQTRWELYQNPRFNGTFQGMQWNGVAPIYESIRGGDERIAVISVILEFEHSESGRYTFVFRDSGNGWQLEDMPDMFPIPKSGSAQQQ